jgi:hypothetical protein
MWNKLKPREKRIIKLLLITVVLIFGYMLFEPIMKDYHQVKAERLKLQETLDDFLSVCDSDVTRKEAIAQMVPVFKIPVKAEQQSILFRDEITQQLQQCGITAKSMQLRQNKSKDAEGYMVWTMECQGLCQYNSIMRFVKRVEKNPYYVAIEKLVLKVDSKDRNRMTYYLTVSTYAK